MSIDALGFKFSNVVESDRFKTEIIKKMPGLMKISVYSPIHDDILACQSTQKRSGNSKYRHCDYRWGTIIHRNELRKILNRLDRFEANKWYVNVIKLTPKSELYGVTEFSTDSKIYRDIRKKVN